MRDELDSHMLAVFGKLEHMDLKGRITGMKSVPLRNPGATCDLYQGVLNASEGREPMIIAIKKMRCRMNEDPRKDHVSFTVLDLVNVHTASAEWALENDERNIHMVEGSPQKHTFVSWFLH